ncbi:MAG: radical SAM protein [Candidatus Absconditicoccaceae bacterium]
MQNYSELVQQLIDTPKNKLGLELFVDYKRNFARKYKMKDLPSNIDILRSYREMIDKRYIKKNTELEQFLKKRKIRSASGIVAIQVLTKPFWCPGECIFCPNDPTMPKSYIKSEPGAMRALLNDFDPLKQVYNRLTSLTLAGHPTDKIEMIVLGGTRDVYPKKYKIDFIKGLYDAANTFAKLKIKSLESGMNDKNVQRFKYKLEGLDKIKYSKTLDESIKRNEKAGHRIIGLTIETRPEYVTDENCKLWREMGVTRIEIGLQSMYDDILIKNKRGHTVEHFRQAIHKLRQYAFKFSVHIMPGLYCSTYAKDLGTFKKIYSDIYVKPDEIKFYPTSVIPNTELYNLYKEGKYKPISTDYIKKLISQTFLEVIPPYTRIKRLIRDIPAPEIAAGSNITNLSQLAHAEIKLKLKSGNADVLEKFYGRLYPDFKIIKKLNSLELKNFIKGKKETLIVGKNPDLSIFRNFVSLDTRSREIRQKIQDTRLKQKTEQVNLIIRKYESSVGLELFISFEDALGYLYGFARLLLPSNDNVIDWKGLGNNTSMIRELHVYGNVAMLQGKNERMKEGNYKVQHKGFGKQLMELAEKISIVGGYKKLSVISGIGVREYYRKLGYRLEGTYMLKILKLKNV